MHMVGERRAKAMPEGDRVKPRASNRGGVGVTHRACGSAEETLRAVQPLDLLKNDRREAPACRRTVGEKTSQPLRRGDHTLTHRHRLDHMIDEAGRGLRHVPAIAGRTHAPSLAGERHDKPRAAAHAVIACESKAEDAALEVVPQFLLNVGRNGTLGVIALLEPALEIV
jgi:hypothetical protein